MFVFLLNRKAAENFGLASDQTCSSSPIKPVGEGALPFQFQRDGEAELGCALHKGDWLFVGGSFLWILQLSSGIPEGHLDS